MPKALDKIQEFERIATGVSGFDSLLGGGLLRGGTYLLMGPPGSGKTILANQLGFYSAAQKGNVIYVTLLAESHARMFGNLSRLNFFRQESISRSIQYVSGYTVLENEGLEGLMKLLGGLVMQHRATMLFIDGVASADELSGSPIQFKKFIHNLNSVVGMSNCSTFLLSSHESPSPNPEHTMVDGIIKLSLSHEGVNTIREVEVEKFRGSGHLLGRHFFRISDTGISIFPRAEAIYGRASRAPYDMKHLISMGIDDLDSLIGGGLVPGSVTSLIGPAGTGKTLLGLQFLVAGAESGEHSLHLSFYEDPSRLQFKAKRLGIDLKSNHKGSVEVLWVPTAEQSIDEIIHLAIEEVEKRKIQRLFVDGVGGLKEVILRPNRISRAMTALAHEVRARGVTTMFTEETELFSENMKVPISDLSATTDNIIYLRHAVCEGRLRRCISVVKVRENPHDSRIHELLISEDGLAIGNEFANMEPIFPEIQRLKSHASKKSTGKKKPASRKRVRG